MTLAADLLTRRDSATVAEVARLVGYADPFAFSAAFKRIRGSNPSDFRRTVRLSGPVFRAAGGGKTAAHE
jgi:AraC-like DNA-binding protein